MSNGNRLSGSGPVVLEAGWAKIREADKRGFIVKVNRVRGVCGHQVRPRNVHT